LLFSLGLYFHGQRTSFLEGLAMLVAWSRLLIKEV